MSNSRHPASAGRWLTWIVALGVLIFGLLFAAGGGYLASLGGSWYFLLAGAGMIVAAVALFRRRLWGAWLFALVMVLTVVWALFDAGLAFWPLVSRLFALAVLSVLVALAYPSLRSANGLPAGRLRYGLAVALLVGVAAGFAGMFVPHAAVSPSGEGPGLTKVEPGKAQKNWEHYGNDAGGGRFAALDQINRDNVSKLVPAWTYHTGDVAISDGNGAEDQMTPLQVGDKVFICTPHNNVIALDADTGKALWKRQINAKSAAWPTSMPPAPWPRLSQAAPRPPPWPSPPAPTASGACSPTPSMPG